MCDVSPSLAYLWSFYEVPSVVTFHVYAWVSRRYFSRLSSHADAFGRTFGFGGIRPVSSILIVNVVFAS